MIKTSQFTVNTQGNNDIHDITRDVQSELENSAIQEGIATVFVSGSTAGITTIEYEPGLVKDVKRFFDKLVPEKDRKKDLFFFLH